MQNAIWKIDEEMSLLIWFPTGAGWNYTKAGKVK